MGDDMIVREVAAKGVRVEVLTVVQVVSNGSGKCHGGVAG